ncbi:DUF1493 family protein [Pseudescherichia vulneris]
MDTVEELNGTYFYAGHSNLTATELFFMAFVMTTANHFGVKDITAIAALYSGVYMFRKKKYDTYTAESSVHFDVRLDVDEAEELMNAFFMEFNVGPGNFKLETYYPEVEFSLNPFKKQIVDVPDFTIGMLIESAKAGKWLYD